MKASLKREILQRCLIKLPKHPLFHRKNPKLHFSLIIQHNAIVSLACNNVGDHIIGWPEHSNIHAEFMVFKKAKGILSHNTKWNVVNVRMNKQGVLRNSHPCASCSRFLILMGVHGIHYTTNDGFCKLR
jgi:tRNA(Arg) A34 adenosine deaminase TadA